MDELLVLAGTAATIGVVHTLLGPDHYLPFIAMARARGWSGARTALVTALCGIGHVLSSILLGFAGVLLGIAVFKLESLESIRGDLAGWLLILFGLFYFLWGIRRATRGEPHTHQHVHADGESHSHVHAHVHAHSHVHASARGDLTPWILFTVFVLGPCEPLIPLLIYPAAKSNLAAAAMVAAVFATTTVATMVGCVMTCRYGLSRIAFPHAERYAHALAGLTILLCGGAIKLLGL